MLLAWFWLTPIIYPFELVTQKLENHNAWSYWHLLNPMTSLLIPIQRGSTAKPSSTTPTARWSSASSGSVAVVVPAQHRHRVRRVRRALRRRDQTVRSGRSKLAEVI
ncbi:MAG: hypothetical protein R2705_11645 [Ilumatobacteraceae bacterium]